MSTLSKIGLSKQNNDLIWTPVPSSSESPLGLLRDLDPTWVMGLFKGKSLEEQMTVWTMFLLLDILVEDLRTCRASLFLADQSCPKGSVAGWSRPPRTLPRGSPCSPGSPAATWFSLLFFTWFSQTKGIAIRGLRDGCLRLLSRKYVKSVLQTCKSLMLHFKAVTKHTVPSIWFHFRLKSGSPMPGSDQTFIS